MPRRKQDGLPSGVRKRKTATAPYYIYEIAFFDGRRQHFERTSTDLRDAKRRLAERKREVATRSFVPGKRAKDSTTVHEFVESWLSDREGDVITHKLDRTRFELHILPVLGDLRVSEVESADIVKLLKVLREKQSARGKPLAANSIRNIYANVVTMFADAEQQGYTLRTPCASVRKAQRPRKAPRSAVQGNALTSEQLSSLISSEHVPTWRRTLYGLMFLGGMRFGEAAGMRWGDYDGSRRPLGHLHVQRQYDDQPLKGRRGSPGPARDVPVHPVLAAMLAEWKLAGYQQWVGDKPDAADFIVPNDDGAFVKHRKMAYWIANDAALLGLPMKQATHIARRTFITMAIAGGAPEAWVRRITHNASGDVLTGYTVNDWPAMCRAVECVHVERVKGGELIALGTASER